MSHSLTKLFHGISATGLALAIGACQTIPPTNVHQPMSARPVPQPLTPATPGAIYQVSNSTPLFEIKRARNVGDIMTIVINEKTNASSKGNSKAERSQTNEFSVPTLAGLPGKSFLNASLSTSSVHKYDGKGETTSSDLFTGTITVTVIEVLPNGNLLVSGEKQLGIDHDTEYLRLSGVVDPATIGFGNSVSSTQVADARIEYRGAGPTNSAQIMGWLAKFFLTFLPF